MSLIRSTVLNICEDTSIKSCFVVTVFSAARELSTILLPLRQGSVLIELWSRDAISDGDHAGTCPGHVCSAAVISNISDNEGVSSGRIIKRDIELFL